MKFCPNCGAVRDDKNICPCGYNYETGEVEEKDTNTGPNEPMPNLIDNFIKMTGVQPFQGGVSLDDLKERKLDVGDLLSVSYCTSGGMMGQYYHTELSFKTNELTTVNQEWHHGSKIQRVYKADEQLVKEIKDILIENNFRAWSELPVDMSMMAYDAPSSSMSLTFEQAYVNINSNVCMTQEENDIYMNVKTKIMSLATDDNKISEETLEEGQSLFAMMGVQSSGEGIPINKKFCPECGTPLEEGTVTCPGCGYEEPKKEA